jgi:hypothetical protein
LKSASVNTIRQPKKKGIDIHLELIALELLGPMKNKIESLKIVKVQHGKTPSMSIQPYHFWANLIL